MNACGEKRGTLTGYNRHSRAWEPACDDCRSAVNAWRRTYRAANTREQQRVQRDKKRQRWALARLRARHSAEYAELMEQSKQVIP